MNDPVADLLTRIRNAQMRRHDALEMPASRLRTAILSILEREGYIKGFQALTPDSGHPALRVELKYVEGRAAIEGLRRLSRPGLRRYVAKGEIPKVQGGFGVAILSTSRGVLTDKDARKNGVGGELLCAVW